MRLFLVFPILCLFTSCDQDRKTASESESEIPACCACETAPEAVEASAESIYQLDSQWKDSSGKERPLKSLAGHTQVISMGYTTCQFSCPRLLADMRAIEESLSEDARSGVHFTFVSIDPERDTPARLAEYRQENEIDSKRWTLLTGSADSVQELAVVMGVQYRKTGDADFAHSNVITVLNPQGEIIYRQEGLGADPAATLKAIASIGD